MHAALPGRKWRGPEQRTGQSADPKWKSSVEDKSGMRASVSPWHLNLAAQSHSTLLAWPSMQ
eukprot:12926306-Prorocentrum_lima.AAC.1